MPDRGELRGAPGRAGGALLPLRRLFRAHLPEIAAALGFPPFFPLTPLSPLGDRAVSRWRTPSAASSALGTCQLPAASGSSCDHNAAELALKSLVLRHDDDLPASHGGIVGRFGRLFVQARAVDKTMGRRVNQALELRNLARYRYQAIIGTEEAAASIDLARQLIGLARSQLP